MAVSYFERKGDMVISMKKAKFAAAITTVSAMLFVCAFSASAENYAVTGSLGARWKNTSCEN